MGYLLRQGCVCEQKVTISQKARHGTCAPAVPPLLSHLFLGKGSSFQPDAPRQLSSTRADGPPRQAGRHRTAAPIEFPP